MLRSSPQRYRREAKQTFLINPYQKWRVFACAILAIFSLSLLQGAMKIWHRNKHAQDTDFASRPWARNIIVSERNRLLFCPVPKAANSNWKYLIRKWEGLEDYALVRAAHSAETSGMRYLSDYSPSEARAILKSPRFFKFVFVRDPYARALSAYMDKLRNVDSRFTPPEHMNAHWQPQTDLCGLDDIDYDFIGRMENLLHDAQKVFNYLNRSKERFPSHADIGFPPSGASTELADELYTVDLMFK
eukprot:IDg5561t1